MSREVQRVLTIHPTNDVTYTTGGLVVGYDGLLWPAETAEGVPEATATLAVVIELSGTAETPTATIPEATASLPVEITLEGTAETPTATVPEATGSLAVEIGLSGSVSHPIHLVRIVVPGSYRPTTVAGRHGTVDVPAAHR